ncbi:hypothetical protein F7Q99_36340 [Streptomyces kaniharaensis]|uniref:Uncharacterized protein n=1 Tax=Streptomyces kaniharaensis TaxID=212423 RepID=A0A6N7L632_9ACTN|nr:hypothetical protein [Streptomyces kaniharaensis]MQS17513.1 hypothetical protein [Streptomyces kaniharaensis]
MSTPAFTVADDVLARIGQHKADELRRRTRTFTCVECGTRGRADQEPVSVVLTTSTLLSRLGFAHHRCSASQVVQVDDGDLAVNGSTDLIPRALGLSTGSGDRAALLLAYEEDVTVFDGSGSAFDPVISHYLDSGLHRLVSLGRMPALSPQWSVQVGPGDRLSVRCGQTHMLSDATMYAPSVWLALAAEAGSVALIIGRLGWDDIYAEQAPWAAYASAIKAGQLVGGTVPVAIG